MRNKIFKKLNWDILQNISQNHFRCKINQKAFHPYGNSVCTSNHVWIVIWDKLLECIFGNFEIA